MLHTLILLAALGQCSGPQCGQFGRPAFSFAPMFGPAFAPAMQVQARGDRAIIHPTLGRQTAHNAWTDAAGQVHYDYSDNPHLRPNQPASPSAAAGPARQTPVGAAGPSLLDLAGQLHSLKQAVDDLKALKPTIAPKPEHFAGEEAEAKPEPKAGAQLTPRDWLEGKCSNCNPDGKCVCPATPGHGGCDCVGGCKCPPAKAKDEPKAEADLPTIPELPRIFAAVSDTGQPFTAESHAPTKTCDADGEECYSYGVDHDKIHPAGPEPHVTTNANPGKDTRELVADIVAPLPALAAYGAEQKDDSDQPYLTVIGDEAARKQVEDDLKGDPEVAAEFKDSFRFNAYDPGFWWVQKHPELASGSPTLLLQDHNGRVLWKQHNYVGGKFRLLRKLRQAKHGIQEAMWLLWLRERIEEEVDLPAIGVIVGGLVVLFVLASPGKKP